jgi:ABC-type transport system involved in multi-copper enzyme maturation permease subunit
MARALWTIVMATLAEAARKRILFATLTFGLVFVALFSIGLSAAKAELIREGTPAVARLFMHGMLAMAGLYAVNFLTVITAALLPVDTLSGEIASGVMQTVAAKPIPRATIVLGKWIGHSIVLASYVLLIGGGLVLVARVVADITPPNVLLGLLLIFFEGLVVLTMSIAAGTRVSTIANGLICVGFYGVAFLGGWFEQIGTLAGVASAATIGTVTSLVFPSEAMWQLAAHHMQPAIIRDLQLTPFSPVSVPSPFMVAWAVGYVVFLLAFAIRSFSRRPL